MALEGTIKDFGLADIFQLIALQKKTGVLTLESKQNTVNIYFQEGKIIYADVLKRWEGDKLGKILEKAGKITREQLERALEIKKGTVHRLGDIFVKENLITKEVLSEALQHQLKMLMFDLFRWKEGSYRFITKKVSYDENILTPVNTEYILMEGMRILDEWPLIEKRIPSFDTVYKKVEVEETVSLSEADNKVLKLVDGESDVGMIIDSCGMGEVETCNCLIRLMDAGLIESSLKMEATIEKDSLRLEAPEVKKAGTLNQLSDRLRLKWLNISIPGLILILLILVAGIRFLDVIKNPIMSILAVNRIEDLRTSIRLYYLEKGEYPSSLKALVTEGSKKDVNIFDPWGRPYIYEKTDGPYEIYSSGPDGIKGNEDDIR